MQMLSADCQDTEVEIFSPVVVFVEVLKLLSILSFLTKHQAHNCHINTLPSGVL